MHTLIKTISAFKNITNEVEQDLIDVDDVIDIFIVVINTDVVVAVIVILLLLLL